MRVLYVNDAMTIYGGLERILTEKINSLSDTYGYEVCLTTINQGSRELAFTLSPRVCYRDLDICLYRQYNYWGIRRLWHRRRLLRLFLQRLRTTIRDFRPDVIVCVRRELIGVVAKASGDIPLVFESHASCRGMAMAGEGLVSRWQESYYNRQVKKAQWVVALTEGDASEWRKLVSNVSVIPNIAHLNESGTFSSLQSKSVIYVGRFSRQKDIGSLLLIWQQVQRRHPDWQLHIYGGYGEQQDKFLSQIKTMGANIALHEPTPDIFTHYAESSILLLTSRYEPFGLVLPEAMSCGLPVVAFDCPYGPADIITDGTDGFLIRNRDIADFADKVCLLMEQPELRHQMGEAAIHSSRRFEASRIMPLWQQLFSRLT